MHSYQRPFLIIACIILGIFCRGPAAAADGINIAAGNQSSVQDKSAGIQNDPATGPIGIYKKYISGADGDRCPMHPSCSGYALEAFKKHGALMGWIMTCDRLLRCGRSETRLSSPIRVNGSPRTYDPVKNNDFWW